MGNGIAIPKKNPKFASAVVIVPKANGKLRFCVNYQTLNSLMILDKHPLPLIEHIILETYGKKHFSSLDKTSGFWNIPNDPKIYKYLAFIT